MKKHTLIITLLAAAGLFTGNLATAGTTATTTPVTTANLSAIVSTGINGMTIGNTTNAFSSLGLHSAVGSTVPWGGSVALNQSGSWLNSASNGGFPQKGLCEFSGLYQLMNTSNASATFTVYLSGGPLTAAYQNYGTFTIGAGQVVSLNSYLYLSAGTYPLTLRVDPGTSTLPSSKSYVIGSINVAMTGACQAAGTAATTTPVTTTNSVPPVLSGPQAGTLFRVVKPDGSTVIQQGNMAGIGNTVNTINVSENDAFLMSGGKCAFNVKYDDVSATAVASSTNRLYSNDNPIAVNSNIALTAGVVKSIWTQPYLVGGLNNVRVVVNADGVAPSTKLIRVYVAGACGAKPATGTTTTPVTTTTPPPATGSGAKAPTPPAPPAPPVVNFTPGSAEWANLTTVYGYTTYAVAQLKGRNYARYTELSSLSAGISASISAKTISQSLYNGLMTSWNTFVTDPAFKTAMSGATATTAPQK